MPPLLTPSLDKTIKLWKVFEKSLRVVSESNHFDGHNTVSPPTQRSLLRLPRTTQQDNIIAAIPRKVYSNAHAYHIHSISVNSDQETYISADDLRINLWNLNISDQSFSEFDLVMHHSGQFDDQHDDVQTLSISNPSIWKN